MEKSFEVIPPSRLSASIWRFFALSCDSLWLCFRHIGLTVWREPVPQCGFKNGGVACFDRIRLRSSCPGRHRMVSSGRLSADRASVGWLSLQPGPPRRRRSRSFAIPVMSDTGGHRGLHLPNLHSCQEAGLFEDEAAWRLFGRSNGRYCSRPGGFEQRESFFRREWQQERRNRKAQKKKRLQTRVCSRFR